ncbi:retrovirus-related pol polyprotein from transposon TNT 1-94 [Tanacetum coccineum]
MATNASARRVEQTDEEHPLFLRSGTKVTNVEDDVDDFNRERNWHFNVDHIFEAMNVMHSTLMLRRYQKYTRSKTMYNTATLLTLMLDYTRDSNIILISREKDNVIRHLKDLVANVNDRSREPYNAIDVTALIEQNDCDRVELEKVKQHYKELYDSIKIMRAHTSEKTSTMLNEIESLKAQLQSKEPCFTSDYVKPRVLAPGMYAIDVKPIPHPLKNNRSAHLNYIGHLKESVETVREIVEEARVVKPLDSSLNYACRYTKLSQELLECVIGTCPKSFNERDNKAPFTPVPRKKQVTFSDKPGTSSSNTQKHKVHQRVQLTNIPVLPSTGVNDSTEASGSKPRSNTKKNRILPAKKENTKEVEVRLRTNKSVWTKVNRVDSSSSSKRVVINSNSESVCKTCNKCVNSASHGMCFVNILNSVNATPTVRIVLNKEKQIWKPKGKLSDNSLNKTKQIWKPKDKLSDNSLYKTQRVWKATGKLFADIGYQWRPTGKKLTLGKLDCGSQWRPTGKKFALGEICQLTKLSVKCSTLYANQQVMLWYLDSGCSKHMTGNRSKLMNFVEKFIGSVRFGNDHLGAIMGYGDYVMGDSVISRVYYVEGLGHNLFSVGQFCDSDLEVAFRKHTCFVRDIKGTDILKGSRGTNLYTISIDEMMKSSPICLLSKASKSKSWLWHRRLNHLNFGTINDLARKDLVRGLPRLKFEKDHLCSACQLGKSKKFSHRPKSENTNMEVLHTLHMDLCGPMRVQSIKGKKYILVIVDDYSRFTWVKFLRSKDETPEFVTNFLKQIQVGLNKTVRFIRTDNGTEFVNQVMSEYYEGVGIFHQKSVPRTPQQNGPCKVKIDIECGSVTRAFHHDPDTQIRARSNQNDNKSWKCYFNRCLMNTLNNLEFNDQIPFSAAEFNAQVVPTSDIPYVYTNAQDAPSTSAFYIPSTSDIHLSSQHQRNCEEETQFKKTPQCIHDVHSSFTYLVYWDPGSPQSSSGNVNAGGTSTKSTKELQSYVLERRLLDSNTPLDLQSKSLMIKDDVLKNTARLVQRISSRGRCSTLYQFSMKHSTTKHGLANSFLVIQEESGLPKQCYPEMIFVHLLGYGEGRGRTLVNDNWLGVLLEWEQFFCKFPSDRVGLEDRISDIAQSTKILERFDQFWDVTKQWLTASAPEENMELSGANINNLCTITKSISALNNSWTSHWTTQDPVKGNEGDFQILYFQFWLGRTSAFLADMLSKDDPFQLQLAYRKEDFIISSIDIVLQNWCHDCFKWNI